MRNKQIPIVLAFLLAFSILVTACTSPTPAPTPAPADTPIPTATPKPTDAPVPTEPPSPFPMTISDGAEREVTIAAEPQAIVSLAPSNTEILYALGLGDRIVGVTEFCNYPPEAAGKPKVGGFSDVDTEKLVIQAPDLVLAANMHAGEVVPALEKLGLTVVVITPPDVPAALDSIKLVGQIAGKDEEATALIAEMQARIDAVTAAVEGLEKPRVYWEVSSDLWTAGPGSFINDLILRAGGENIAAAAESPWAQLSNESIIASDPEIIFLADHPFGETAETVAARPGWGDISAVVNGRIIEIEDTDMFSRPGPRVVDALEMAAAVLHPDAFE
jgi:iron complex transport system substrate-binding protein